MTVADPTIHLRLGSARERREIVRRSAAKSLRRRLLIGRFAESLCLVALLIALIPVGALFYFTAAKGWSVISWQFLTTPPAAIGVPGGGISTAIAGTLRLIGVAILMSVPLALFVALFIRERKGRIASAVRFTADVLVGVPSIVVGIFAYAVLVRTLHHFSFFAASFALAVLMVPIMVRADEEAMATVPVDLWEAGVALGAPRSRVARTVVLRNCLSGLVTGNLLAISRGVGETAPLIFTLAAPTAAMTLLIFNDGTQAFTSSEQTAWGTAFVLLAMVLLLSAAARGTAWLMNRRFR